MPLGGVQVSQDVLKLNSAHGLLVYPDDDYILAGCIYTIKEDAEALVVSSKEMGLAVNADKTEYLVMS